jgi:uncharacterized integral membrane protein (TIGR00698 family)
VTAQLDRPAAAVPAPAPSAHGLRSLLPGLALIAVGVGIAYAISVAVPALSALTAAVVLGAVARNCGLVVPAVLPGTTAATKRLLRTGVVFLGLQLAVGQILHLGPGELIVVAATVSVTFGTTLLIGRRLGVGRGTTLLVATGFSICGAAAAAAVDAASDTTEEDLATAVALVTIFGGITMFVLPSLQGPLHLSDTAFGLWSGASIHEVAQVVAAASAAGSAALAVAVVVKLTRVVLLAPLVAGVSISQRRRTGDRSGVRPPLVPLFVVGFLAMVGLRSTGVLPGGVLDAAKTATTLLLAAALFGLGTSVDVRSLVRTGGRSALLGLCSTLVALTVSYLGVLAVS